MTYPEMNKQIVRILRTYSEPDILYAANRIEELERQLEQIIGLWGNFETRLEQISILDPALYQEIDDEFSEQIINISTAVAGAREAR